MFNRRKKSPKNVTSEKTFKYPPEQSEYSKQGLELIRTQRELVEKQLRELELQKQQQEIELNSARSSGHKNDDFNAEIAEPKTVSKIIKFLLKFQV